MSRESSQLENVFKTFLTHIAAASKKTSEVEMIAQRYSVSMIVQIMASVLKMELASAEKLSMVKTAASKCYLSCMRPGPKLDITSFLDFMWLWQPFYLEIGCDYKPTANSPFRLCDFD